MQVVEFCNIWPTIPGYFPGLENTSIFEAVLNNIELGRYFWFLMSI